MTRLVHRGPHFPIRSLSAEPARLALSGGDAEMSVAEAPEELAWVGVPDAIILTEQQPEFDLLTLLSAPEEVSSIEVDSSGNELPEGVTLTGPKSNILVWDEVAPSDVSGVRFAALTAGSELAMLEADWQARISGPGVVFYHGFDDPSEVDAFRWRNSVGNDPGALGTNSHLVRQIETDGIRGKCMELVNQAGTVGNADFWRPLSPMQARAGGVLGNGRDTDDPGANGTIPAQVWDPKQGGSQTAGWRKGYYGHPFMDGDGGYFQDGHEYWLQYMVKFDPKILTAVTTNGGKLLYLTRTDQSLTSQELVVVARNTLNADPNNSYFTMYRSGSPPLTADAPGQGSQPGIEGGIVSDGLCSFSNTSGRLANCWQWPMGQWVCVMLHVKGGTNAGLVMPSASGSPSGNPDTLVEVKVCEFGQTQWRTIWNQDNVQLPFDVFPGHNALIFSTYMNNAPHSEDVYKRVGDIIFSQQEIPCPQVWPEPA